MRYLPRRLILVSMFGIILVGGCVSRPGSPTTAAKKDGLRFVFAHDFSTVPVGSTLKPNEIRDNTVRKLEIVAQSLTEGGAVVGGNAHEVVVELPGYLDVAAARKEFLKNEKFGIYHARNVTTALVASRTYSQAGTGTKGSETYITFTERRHPEKELSPGDAEYAKMIEGWDLILSSAEILYARPELMGEGKYIPLVTFNATGSTAVEAWSRRYSNREENVAFIIGDSVISFAPLKRGAILRDNAMLAGEFTTESVKSLTDRISASALTAHVKEIRVERMLPSDK
ncbi:MAG: hypothetical protein KF784_06965 [Fimbriimonadaceae bacterium]|nr:hypothetical protein [Fimbriimonadaceae bacterium]